VQKVLKPFFEKIEIIANSETLWTKVLEKSIISPNFSLNVLKKLIKYLAILQKESKPHLTLLPDGRLRGRRFKTAYFQK
jgi:hypothetical protein